MASKPQRNMERYSKGQKISKTFSRGTKKPPTNRKGMMRTGTRAMTTPASEKRVERMKPKAEDMKAQSSRERTDLKKTEAELSRLTGKQATTMKRKTVKIQTGWTAAILPKKQAEVQQVLLRRQRMKTGRSKLKRLTEEKTQAKPVFMTRKNSTPWLFWMIYDSLVPASQQRMMQMMPKKIDWNTLRMTSRGCRNWLTHARWKMTPNWWHHPASWLASIWVSCELTFFSCLFMLCLWRWQLPTRQSTRSANSFLIWSSVQSSLRSMQLSMMPSLFISFMQQSVGLVWCGTGRFMLSKYLIESAACPSKIMCPSTIRIMWLNSMKISEDGWWMVEMTVLPFLASLFRKRTRLSEVVESRPVVGSSRKMIEGLISSYSPIEVLFFYPPETPRMRVSPMQVSLHFCRPRFLMMLSTTRSRSSSEISLRRRSVTNLKASQGVKVGSMQSSCMTQPMQFLNLRMEGVSSPLTRSVPRSSRLSDNCRPEMRLSMVVLPQPEGPRMAVKVSGEKQPLHSLRMFLVASTSTVLPSTSSSTLMFASTLMRSYLSSIGSTASNTSSSSSSAMDCFVFITSSAMKGSIQ